MKPCAVVFRGRNETSLCVFLFFALLPWRDNPALAARASPPEGPSALPYRPTALVHCAGEEKKKQEKGRTIRRKRHSTSSQKRWREELTNCEFFLFLSLVYLILFSPTAQGCL